MNYLVVGLDRRTLTPWQRHVRRHDVAAAALAAVAHAAADGVDLVVAAVIGPGSNALDIPARFADLSIAA
jgi:hypothetical protein